MTFDTLAETFEEKLIFYTGLMDRLNLAVEEGSAGKLETYSELEAQTGRELAELRRCFLAREGESPHAAARERRLETLMEKARAASQKTRSLLRREKASVAKSLEELRKKPRPANFGAAAPSPTLIDMEA
ncbi:MAG: hypothetical protein LBC67_07570 [Spirochaetales bacterium]|jgi:methylphosphotriester-DNA--protein-cysteine methyltransferase|nr:hypothetical protein [Spirochaetales bacterium]